MKRNILITGGAGYIGCHTAYEALDAGHTVSIIDNLSTGIRANIPKQCTFYEEDISNQKVILPLLKKISPDIVLHFAGSVIVPESVTNPIKYYHNNSFATLSLIEACIKANINYFIFSSTAAVYGIPEMSTVSETSPTNPINPYGQSKLMTESMLQDIAKAHDFKYAILRYFNVAGADPKQRCGQSTPHATYLIKVACETLLGKHKSMKIFGTDYDTPDGTCIRDFIHVSDLARAHLEVMEHIIENNTSEIFNCGNGCGYSVKDILDVAQKMSGIPLTIETCPRRAGDTPALMANSEKLQSQTGWKAKHTKIEDMIQTALEWERKV